MSRPVQIVANGRRNVRYRDGRPLAIAVTEGLREQCVPLVRTFQFANHCPRTCSGHLGKPEQASACPGNASKIAVILFGISPIITQSSTSSDAVDL